VAGLLGHLVVLVLDIPSFVVWVWHRLQQAGREGVTLPPAVPWVTPCQMRFAGALSDTCQVRGSCVVAHSPVSFF
jgi:hypothetical protein